MADNAAMSGEPRPVLTVAAEELGRQIAAEQSGAELPPLPPNHLMIPDTVGDWKTAALETSEWADRMLGYKDAELEDARAAIATRDSVIAKLQHEVEALTSMGTIECAVRNPAVAEYMRHWEGRAEKAEAKIAERDATIAGLREEIAELKAELDAFRFAKATHEANAARKA